MFVVGVSFKKYKFNGKAGKRGRWMIYYYDVDGLIHTRKTNILGAFYYRFQKRRTKELNNSMS